jgi:hypothetical protein
MILGYTRPRGEAGDIEPGPCFGLQKTRKKTNNCSAQDLQCTLGKIYILLIKCVKGVCTRTKLIQLQESSILLYCCSTVAFAVY